MLLRRYGEMQNTNFVLDIFIKTSTRSSKGKHWRICCGPLIGQLMWTSGPWTERSWGHRTWRHIIGWMASPPTSGWKHTSEISPSVTSCWTTCQRCTTGKLQLVHFSNKQVLLCLTHKTWVEVILLCHWVLTKLYYISLAATSWMQENCVLYQC